MPPDVPAAPAPPAPASITPEEFRASGYEAILDANPGASYSAMWTLFRVAADAAEAAGDGKARVLALLVDVVSMMLSSDTPGEPFKPLAWFEGRRSAIPADLRAHVDLFADVAGDTKNRLLRARLADLVWELERKRGQQFAQLAIDTYREARPDPATWFRGEREIWARALDLASRLGKHDGGRLEEMETALLAAFDNADAAGADNNGALRFAQMLDLQKLGRKKARPIAERLAGVAAARTGAADHFGARVYFEVARRWYTIAGDRLGAADMAIGEAESWAGEAAQRDAAPGSAAVVADFLEKAIDLLRMVPAARRAVLGLNDRIDALRLKLLDAGERAVGEMQTFTTQGPDIGAHIDAAVAAVQGKQAGDAVRAFCAMYGGPVAANHRTEAEDLLKDSPLRQLFAGTLFSGDGRVVKKTPAAGGANAAEEHEERVWGQMVGGFNQTTVPIIVHLVVRTLDVLRLEHNLQLDDFITLARNSPIVPPNRAVLFGKGLYAGYCWDFVTALHILVPQVENLVRYHLKNAGEHTTTLIDGISNEMGLSSLVNRGKMIPVFGEDTTFEIRAVFCDASGPNLRNELAHGLLSEGACESAAGIYAWYFALRIVFGHFWNAQRPPRPTDPGDGDGEPEGVEPEPDAETE